MLENSKAFSGIGVKDDDERPQLEPPVGTQDTTAPVAPRERDTV